MISQGKHQAIAGHVKKLAVIVKIVETLETEKLY